MNKLLDLVLKSPLSDLSSYLNETTPDLSSLLDSSNLTILHLCVANNKEPQMRIILHYSKSLPKLVYNNWINHQSREGYTPLLLAISKGHFDCVKLLVQFDADIYARTSLGLDIMHLCAQNNNALILSFFYERNFPLFSRDNKGGTSLHWAAYMGSFTVLSLLLALGIDKNVQDNDGRTPLHLAVISANEKAARKLLVYGVDPEIKDKRGRIPIDNAVEANAIELIKMLRPLNAFEIISCKNRVKEPEKSLKHLAGLIIFLSFAYIFIMVFCAKENNAGTWIFNCIIVLIIADFLILITIDPGYVRKGKNVSLVSLYSESSGDVCIECKIVRPPRSRHCYYCDRCVFRYDHHCQWINNCVGLYNNNYFFIFLFLVILLCIVADYIAIDNFIDPKNDGFLREENSIPAAAVILLVSTLALYPVSLLFIIQFKNYYYNQTSSERLSKGKKIRKPGHCLVNFWKMSCNKV